MTQPNTVTVHIMDKEYCIACPPEERSNLEGAARYLDRKMRDIRSSGKVIGADRVAVMAALNITHELLHKNDQLDAEASSAREHVRMLLERVDSALATDRTPQATDRTSSELSSARHRTEAEVPRGRRQHGAHVQPRRPLTENHSS